MKNDYDYSNFGETQSFYDEASKTIVFYKIDIDQNPQIPVTLRNARGVYRNADFDCNGSILVFENQADADAGKRIMNTNHNAILLSCFRHSGESWGIMGTMDNMPDARWDLTRYAGVWIPDKQVYDNLAAKRKGPERTAEIRKYCEGVLDTFNQYCNGDVYLFNVSAHEAEFDEDGTPFYDEDDYAANKAFVNESCGGIYGLEYAEQELKEAIDSAIREGRGLTD